MIYILGYLLVIKLLANLIYFSLLNKKINKLIKEQELKSLETAYYYSPQGIKEFIDSLHNKEALKDFFQKHKHY